MKKFFGLTVAVALFAFAANASWLDSAQKAVDTAKDVDAATSATYKADQAEVTSLNSCLAAEAQKMLTANTLFAGSVSATAKSLASVCIKKLALQKAGLNETAVSSATKIINGLKSAE